MESPNDYDHVFLDALKRSKGSDTRSCALLINDYVKKSAEDQGAVSGRMMNVCLWAAIELGQRASQNMDADYSTRLDAVATLVVLSQWSLRVKIKKKILDDVLGEVERQGILDFWSASFIYSLLLHRSLWRTRMSIIERLLRRECERLGVALPARASRAMLLDHAGDILGRFQG